MLFPNAEFKVGDIRTRLHGVQGVLGMLLRHTCYGWCPSLLSVCINKCSFLWLLSVQALQALQRIASGIWRMCSLCLLYVFTCTGVKPLMVQVLLALLWHFVTGEMHDILKNVWPIMLGFVSLCWFLYTSSDIRGVERTLSFFHCRKHRQVLATDLMY